MSDFNDILLQEIEEMTLETGLDEAEIDIETDELEGRGVCYLILKSKSGDKRIATFYEDAKAEYEFQAATELAMNAFSLVLDLVAEIKAGRANNNHRAARFLLDRTIETISDEQFNPQQVVDTLRAVSSLLFRSEE